MKIYNIMKNVKVAVKFKHLRCFLALDFDDGHFFTTMGW